MKLNLFLNMESRMKIKGDIAGNGESTLEWYSQYIITAALSVLNTVISARRTGNV
jgi:hypothetical protein